jgi:hemoglobin
MKSDIQTPEDVSLLVDRFYEEVMKSEKLIPYFKQLNWNDHIPRMKQFWRFILLGESGYTTNVTEKHLQMPLDHAAFKEWLALFDQVIDQNFEGEKATLAKQRAQVIAWGIQGKMGLLKN